MSFLERNNETGGALVELALIVPILAVIIPGIIILGIALQEKQIVLDAAVHGAQQAASASGPGALDCQDLNNVANSTALEFINSRGMSSNYKPTSSITRVLHNLPGGAVVPVWTVRVDVTRCASGGFMDGWHERLGLSERGTHATLRLRNGPTDGACSDSPVVPGC